MRQVGVYEAKTQLARLLEDVERGATIIITRHGKPVARLIAIPGKRRSTEEAIEAIRDLRQGRFLHGLTTRALIDEGRKR